MKNIENKKNLIWYTSSTIVLVILYFLLVSDIREIILGILALFGGTAILYNLSLIIDRVMDNSARRKKRKTRKSDGTYICKFTCKKEHMDMLDYLHECYGGSISKNDILQMALQNKYLATKYVGQYDFEADEEVG